MKLAKKLELIYIPAMYWNEPSSGFELISQETQFPLKTNFFLLWIPLNQSEDKLKDQIKLTFPNIPIKKLLTCKINLALPINFSKAKNNDISEDFFKITSHIGKIIPISPATKLLYQLELGKNPDLSKIHYTNSIKTWALLTKLVFELLNRGQFVPVLEKSSQKFYNGQWRLILKSQFDNERFKSILSCSTWPAFCLPANFISDGKVIKTSGLWHPSYIFSSFIDSVGDYLIRSTLNKINFPTFEEFYGTEIQKEKDPDFKLGWDYKFLKALIKKDSIFKVDEFSETILPTLIKNWTQSAYGFQLKHEFTLNLELTYPEKVDSEWGLRFSLLLPDRNKVISLNEIWEGNHLEKSEYLEIIMRALGTASKIFPPIKRAFSDKIQHEIKITASEVMDFLKYPKDLLIQLGFNIILPEVFTRGGKQRLTARLIIRSKDAEKLKKGKAIVSPSIFDINSMLEAKWEASLGGKKISEDEFHNLINSKEPLINVRGEWVLVDQQDIEDLENVNQFETKSYMEALKLGLTGEIQLTENGQKYDVVVEGEICEIINRIQSIESFEEISCPSLFNGNLRHYQQDSLTWMVNMIKFNFGLCLADDMGLGKTVQIIAFLLFLKENYPDNPGSTLIVCPTSILFNWSRELKKFGPELEVVVHHGPNRYTKASDIPEFLKPHRIFLTSYGTIRNDVDFLEAIQFSGIIIDESQNMKNYTSKQTQAIYKLQSQYRICLSGTPIENRLLELWSLFNFLNPGLLGSRSEFQEKYILPIERFQNQEVINNLKTIIIPFIMRRVKTDKTIIKDLPEKNEIKIIVQMSEKQVKMYQELVENTWEEIKTIKSDERKQRGLILGLLVKLKQICNHPSQYLKTDLSTLKDNKDMNSFISQSQKLERLIEMTDEVISNGEKVLIFTQFTQMGDIIKKVLEWKYGFRILYFHGSVPEQKRRVIIDEFQSDDIDSSPILILSLKAGGTGLNLTRGTTVIHIDRWWNPAVEEQATDRAYRIGQKSVVYVYKFVTSGTIEEKIDALLEEKKELADKIITSTGESWISDLNEEKLRELLVLSN
ncbi:MAG: DEAD/DEAH box helicase [Promethearchaeota archaeon]